MDQEVEAAWAKMSKEELENMIDFENLFSLPPLPPELPPPPPEPLLPPLPPLQPPVLPPLPPAPPDEEKQQREKQREFAMLQSQIGVEITAEATRMPLVAPHDYEQENQRKNWETKYGALKKFMSDFKRAPKFDETYDGVPVGRFATESSVMYSNGTIRKYQMEKLGILPDWAWDIWEYDAERLWEVRYNTVRSIANARKEGVLAITEKRGFIYEDINLGMWVLAQLFRSTRRELTDAKNSKLVKLRNWNGLIDQWKSRYPAGR